MIDSEKTELIKRLATIFPSLLVPEFSLGENIYLIQASWWSDELSTHACLDASFGEISKFEESLWEDFIYKRTPVEGEDMFQALKVFVEKVEADKNHKPIFTPGRYGAGLYRDKHAFCKNVRSTT